MDAKLTLKLDNRVIERAKAYAGSRNLSLSRIVESYLMSITSQRDETSKEIKITAFVKSLSKGSGVPANLDYKKEYGDYLDKKYS